MEEFIFSQKTFISQQNAFRWIMFLVFNLEKKLHGNQLVMMFTF